MMRLTTKRVLAGGSLAGVLAISGFALSRVHTSGGEWMVQNASLPAGWPDITPVGEVRVRQYPAYRQATFQPERQPADRRNEIRGEDMIDESMPEGWPEITPVGEMAVKEYPAYREAIVEEDRERSSASRERPGMNEMFMTLFRHIQQNDIPMTTPVDMGYEQADNGSARMDSMAFLYRTQEVGEPGQDGDVVVHDVPARTWATIGVRGDYTRKNFEKARTELAEWLESQTDWVIDGDPVSDARYLGYNGPFVPAFARYGEVQIPVKPAGEGDQPSDAQDETPPNG